MTSDAENTGFPCTRIPEDAAHARRLGLYPQRQEGQWMQRVKILGGRLLPEQWTVLAEIAEKPSPTTPLHLTTRQDVEIHNLTADQVPAVQARLAGAGLTCVGACGDALRNITICPCSGAAHGTVDLGPVAGQIRDTIEAMPDISALPRKFKISLSACSEACAQPWINDLGLVAQRRGGRWGFQVTVAGSLGARPATAILWKDFVPPAEAPALAVAAVTVFLSHGDRHNRRRARLRHVRQRLGNAPFLRMLEQARENVSAERAFAAPPMPVADNGFDGRLLLTFPNGDVTGSAARALAALAARTDVVVRIDNHHRVVLFGPSDDFLRDAVGQHAPLAEAARPQVAVIACPGTRWCSRALADTNDLADRIRRQLGAALPAGMTICISGCPNGCSHPAVADVGLIGKLTGGPAQEQCYDLWVGGGLGRTDELAEPRARRLAPDQAVEEIRAYLAPTSTEENA